MNGIDLDKIKMGMLVCFKSDGGWVNNRIVNYQKRIGIPSPACYITHVGVSAGGPYMISARLPRSKVDNIFEQYQGRIISFLYWKGDYFRNEKRKNVAFWAATRSNLPYGILGLIGFWIREWIPFWGINPLSTRKAPFCSMLVAWAFRREGFDPTPGVSTGLVTPGHLAASRSFETVNVYREDQGATDLFLRL